MTKPTFEIGICYHGEPVKEDTVQDQEKDNYGKTYWACNQEDSCGFFSFIGDKTIWPKGGRPEQFDPEDKRFQSNWQFWCDRYWKDRDVGDIEDCDKRAPKKRGREADDAGPAKKIPRAPVKSKGSRNPDFDEFLKEQKAILGEFRDRLDDLADNTQGQIEASKTLTFQTRRLGQYVEALERANTQSPMKPLPDLRSYETESDLYMPLSEDL